MSKFDHNILSTYGSKGKSWLKNLPNLVGGFAMHWNLSNLKPVNNLSYNYVLSGLQENQPVILKLGLDVKGLNTEASALKAFNGYGVVDLIDQAEGALLLEQTKPGFSLKQFFPKREPESIIIVCDVICRLHHAQQLVDEKNFPTICDWLTDLDKPYEMLGKDLLKARVLRDELLNTMDDLILLHGDLHHENILSHGVEWRVIDPKGVIGELAYEVGAFIRNPLYELPDYPGNLAIVEKRITEFSEKLNLNFSRITKWCFVQTVLSVVWAIEDNLEFQRLLKSLQIFELLLSRNL